MCVSSLLASEGTDILMRVAHVASPLAGFLTDRVGPAWVAAALLFAGIPWWGALTRTFSLAFFIASFAIESALHPRLVLAPTECTMSRADFFIAAVVSPVTAELASITRTMDGVGCKFRTRTTKHKLSTFPDAHSYGTFNIIFGLGNAGKNITSPDVHRHAELTGSASPAGAIVGGQVGP